MKTLSIVTIFNSLLKLFHRCKFETINIPHSNQKGEIWLQQCKCSNKREVLFDSAGKCRQIKQLK